MAILKCKMCGGELNVTDTDSVIKCEFCGTSQTVPSIDAERKANLFNRAVQLRLANEFDRATAVYDSIISEFPNEAEAYWGLVLCKYGIEYVDDAPTGLKLPTCHRTYYENIFTDENYLKAVENADVIAREMYENEAYIINEIQKTILEIAANEEPFDIFISYRERDELGERTKDSVLAQEIYYNLTNEGYKVFFSRITLENKLGTQYEPYIFAALNSAKIMLVVGTSPENFNAVWVKNEWQRFIGLMKNDKSRVIIPAYRDMDAYDLPDSLAVYQAQDMSKLAFMQDIINGIKKMKSLPDTVSGKTADEVSEGSLTADIIKLLKRINICIENGEISAIDQYCNKILDIDPDFGEAICLKNMVKNGQRGYKTQDWDGAEVSGDYLINSEDKRIIGFYRLKENLVIDENAGFIDCLPFYSMPELENIEICGDIKAGRGVLAFCGCAALKSVKLPEGLKEIDSNAFRDCTALNDIDIPDSVEVIGDFAFYNCVSLENIKLPSKLADIGNSVFGCCKDLENIEFSNAVEDIDAYAFFNCASLERIILPKGLKNIGEHAFDGCSSLICIDIPEGVGEIKEYSFQDCTSLKTVHFPPKLEKLGMWTFRNCTALEEIIVPDIVKEVEEGTFNGCISLKTAVLPKKLEKIEIHSFNGCKALERIDIPASVEFIARSAFDNCETLKIHIPDPTLDKLIEKDKRDTAKWFDLVADNSGYVDIRSERGELLTSSERKARRDYKLAMEKAAAEKQQRTELAKKEHDELMDIVKKAQHELSELGIFDFAQKNKLKKQIDDAVERIEEIRQNNKFS